MAERCCRARRCGLVSLVVVVSRAVSQLRARAAVVIVIAVAAKSVADVGGIAGVDAMRVGDVVASAMHLGPMRLELRLHRRSFARSRVE